MYCCTTVDGSTTTLWWMLNNAAWPAMVVSTSQGFKGFKEDGFTSCMAFYSDWGGGTLFGFWVKGWSIPQRVARLPPIIRRMLFKQIPPGITFRRLNLYKSQASEMAWKTVLSLAELTPNHGKISSRTRHMFLYMHPEGTVQSALSPVKSVEIFFF